jgi:hypothetical protein
MFNPVTDAKPIGERTLTPARVVDRSAMSVLLCYLLPQTIAVLQEKRSARRQTLTFRGGDGRGFLKLKSSESSPVLMEGLTLKVVQ